MTAPAHATTPDPAVVSAARLMDRHGVKRLPVVDADGRQTGIVSRRDLLKVFLRPDLEIERDAAGLDITVADGVVTLSGTLTEHSQALTTVSLTENIDGVVAVRNHLAWKHDDIVEIPVWGGA